METVDWSNLNLWLDVTHLKGGEGPHILNVHYYSI